MTARPAAWFAAAVVVAVLVTVAACGDDGGSGVPDGSPDAQIDAGPAIDAVACVEDGTGQGNDGFVRPNVVSRAWQETAPQTWTEIGPADWSCAPRRLRTTRIAGAIGGLAFNVQNGGAIDSAVVDAFVDGDISTPTMTATANGSGNYTFDLPDANDLVFRVTATDYVPTFSLAPEPTAFDDGPAMSVNTATALPALVGVTYDDKPLAIGAVRDCAGNHTSDVVVTVSLMDDCVAQPANTSSFYYADNNLPVRNSVEPVANANGMFMVILDGNAVGQIQVWGFAMGDDPATAPLRLLATRDAILASSAVALVASPYGR